MKKILVALVLGLLASAALALPWGPQMGHISGIPPIPPPTLTGVTLSNLSFTCGTAGTVGAIAVQGKGNISAATLSLSGADAAQFGLSSTTAPSNLTVGGSPAGCPRSYNVNVVATLAGATNSPFTQGFVVTGTIPGTVPCDQGPNVASIPAPAMRAGFTTCALNADFRTNSTDNHGVNFSDTKTFVDICGPPDGGLGSNPVFSVYWWAVTSVRPNCVNDAPITITTDGGTQVLQFLYLPSTQNTACTAAGLDPTKVNCGIFYILLWPHGFDNNNGLPWTKYIEIYARVQSANSLNQQVGSTENIDMWDNGTQFQGQLGSQELDFFEQTPNGGPPWSGGWEGDPSGKGVVYGTNTPSVDFTTYHKFGQLITADGVSNGNIFNCGIIDDVYSGCTQADNPPPNAGAVWTYHGYSFEIDLGGAAGNGAADGCGIQPGSLNLRNCVINNVVLYIQYIRIFTCSGYVNGQCFGTGSQLVSGP